MRHRGRLMEWNDERGFGFVTSLEDQSRAFVHVSQFPHEMRRPQPLDLLTYDIRLDDRGRLQAFGVQFLAPAAHREVHSRGPRDLPAWPPLTGLAVAFVAAAVIDASTTVALLLGYAVMSIVTFGAYAADKAAAQQGRFRTQESALHLLELLGGWPGALAAQRVLRHKTVKRSYQTAFWICVALNVVGLPLVVWFASSTPG